MSNHYQSKRYRIKEVVKQTDDNILMKIKSKLNPQPGQFVEVSIPGIGEAPISSASYNNKELDLNIRTVGAVTKATSELKKGDKIYLRGPYGNGYPMKEFKGHHLILIGGGCGVAPLKGIIEYIEKNRNDYRDVHLFFGYRSPKDVLFKEEIEEWKQKYHFNLSVDQAAEDNPFNCPVGFVTQILEKTDIPKEGSIVMMCGPPIMMTKTSAILEKKGFSKDQIWVSLERNMKCSHGKCGHCMVHGKYVCIDGPVFRYDEVKDLDE